MTLLKYSKKEDSLFITACERGLQEEREVKKQLMNEPSQPKKKRQSYFIQGSFI